MISNFEIINATINQEDNTTTNENGALINLIRVLNNYATKTLRLRRVENNHTRIGFKQLNSEKSEERLRSLKSSKRRKEWGNKVPSANASIEVVWQPTQKINPRTMEVLGDQNCRSTTMSFLFRNFPK